MDDITARVEFLINHFDNGKKQDFAKRIRVSKSTITRVVTKGEAAGGKVLTNILKHCPEVRAEWLMRGDGTVFFQKSKINLLEDPGVTYKTRAKSYVYARLIEQVGQLQEIIRQLKRELLASEEEE